MKNVEQAKFWNGRSVGLTGATGFIGHHVAILLRKFGAHVTALVRPASAHERLSAAGVQLLEGDLCSPASLTQLCTGKEFIFHVAGAVSFDSDWARIREVNVECARSIAAAARRAGVGRLVHTSSVVAIGASRRPVVLDETSEWTLESLRVPYVTTKREGELAVLSDGVDVVAINPTCVIGPNDFSGSEFGTLCRRFWKGRIPFHFGGGNNFVDVRDVALGHLLAGSLGRSGQRYILGAHDLTYHDFFRSLAVVAGRRRPPYRLPHVFGRGLAPLIEWIARRRGNRRPYLTTGQVRLLSHYFYVSSAKAARELGYAPRPLETTLADAFKFWMHGKTAETDRVKDPSIDNTDQTAHRIAS